MSVLIIAPHADDETLGMGGTIARLTGEGTRVSVAIMTGPGTAPHPLWTQEEFEQTRSEAVNALQALGVADLTFGNLPAACITETPVHLINQAVSDVIKRVNPKELYLPFCHDLHNDHGLIAYAGFVHARAYLEAGKAIQVVAMYETPTETHLLSAPVRPAFVPNMWVDISATLDAKLAAWNCYRSQHLERRTPRSPDALRALAMMRGADIGVAAAEAFMITRLTRRLGDH